MARAEQLYSVSDEILKAGIPLLTKLNGAGSKLLDFAATLIVTCAEAQDRIITSSELRDALKNNGWGSSKSTLSKYTKELFTSEAVNEVTVSYEGSPRSCLTLNSVSHLPHFRVAGSLMRQKTNRGGRPQKMEQQSLFASVAEEHSSSAVGMVDAPAASRIEGLFCILDTGMRISAYDNRKEIRCKYYFGQGSGDFIEVHSTARSTDGSNIALLSDERAMRAINGVLVDHLEKTYGPISAIDPTKIKLIDELFCFDIYDLCRRMGMTACRVNADIVRGMIERLKDTTFTIDAKNSKYFRENYSLRARRSDFRFITEYFQGGGEGGESDDTGRYFIIKVHTAILANLILTGRSFLCHAELNKDRDGMAHRLNNWNKSYIGVREKEKKEFVYTLVEFRDLAMPSASVEDFQKHLIRLMKRQCIELVNDDGQSTHTEATPGWFEGETNVAWLYGYYYRLEWDAAKVQEHLRKKRSKGRINPGHPLITIWRDVEDPFVGDASDHNLALARQSNELLALSAAKSQPAALAS